MNRERVEEQDAMIKRIDVMIDDHNLISFCINLEYQDKSIQTLSFMMDEYDPEHNRRRSAPWVGPLIRKIMEVLQVTSLKELEGRWCRVKYTSGRVQQIGHMRHDHFVDVWNFVEQYGDRRD